STKAGIHVNLGTTASPADTTILCADIGTNNAPNSGSTDASAGSDYVVRERQSTTMRLPGYTGTTTDIAAVATYIKNRNTNGASSSVFVATPGVGAPGYTNTIPAGSQCVQPVLPSGAMFKPEGSKQQQFFALLNTLTGTAESQNAPTSSLALLSTTISLSDVLNYAPAATASDSPIVAFGRVEENRPASAGASQVVMPTVAAEASVGAVDSSGLPGASAKNSRSSFANAIAAMIEPTAHAETNQRSGIRDQRSDVRLNHAVKAEIRGEAAGVRGQESGIRLNHARANSRLKTENSKLAATAAAPPTPVGSFPINGTGAGQGFQLPNNKTITITFKATLNAPPNLSGPSNPKVTAQATLTGSFVGNPLVSDDPSVGGTTDPTSTNVDLYDSTATLSASPSNSTNTGQAVTFTATIGTSGTPNGSATNRTGTVNFLDNGVSIGCGSQPVSHVGSNDVATCTTSSLTTGSHTNITAAYSGDGNFDPSTSSAFTQTISKSGTNATLVSSLNPATVTQNITFTFTISSATSVPGPPTGTVTFKDGAATISCSNVGGQVLNGSGVATCQTSSLTATSHTITADYPGDTNFNANAGVALTASGGQNGNPQVVNKATPSVTLVSSLNPAFIGQTVTFTATVAAPGGVTGTPTGTLTFKDGGVAMTCTGGNQTLSAGVATCQKNNLSAGSHT
ncbi:MAG TPA: Ig-like domain-containing protein, partial [Pyrinomonadaceae bacterium]|nr:Ig-like domain-containing protein [Pyrinomonadaceae bacterium]